MNSFVCFDAKDSFLMFIQAF